MPRISVKNVSLEFAVHGSDARSLRKTFISKVTGGKLLKSAMHTVHVKALDDINLEVAAGERIGLIGHNGAGKTTLLRVLAGLYCPTAGIIEIEGQVTSLLDPFAGMDGDASGVDNIFIRGALVGLRASDIRRRLPEIAATSQLGEFLDLPVRTYSAGMFARLSFAVSSVLTPDILLIDEGFGAGDTGFVELMHAKLGQLSETTILLLASHDTAFIAKFCNVLVRFEHGKIASIVRKAPPEVASCVSPAHIS